MKSCFEGRGHGLSRFLAKTKFAGEALLLVDGQRKMETAECPGMRMSSPTRVVQSCLKLGSGSDQLALGECGLRQTSTRKPPSG